MSYFFKSNSITLLVPPHKSNILLYSLYYFSNTPQKLVVVSFLLKIQTLHMHLCVNESIIAVDHSLCFKLAAVFHILWIQYKLQADKKNSWLKLMIRHNLLNNLCVSCWCCRCSGGLRLSFCGKKSLSTSWTQFTFDICIFILFAPDKLEIVGTFPAFKSTSFCLQLHFTL